MTTKEYEQKAAPPSGLGQLLSSPERQIHANGAVIRYALSQRRVQLSHGPSPVGAKWEKSALHLTAGGRLHEEPIQLEFAEEGYRAPE
jgi:hypothetical protein